MSLLECLNCKCDTLVKAVVHTGIYNLSEQSMDHWQLPLESVSICYQGSKISTECGNEIHFQVGQIKARRYYIGELGWFPTAFDAVDWEARDRALDKKPDIYKFWICNQGLSFCLGVGSATKTPDAQIVTS